MRILSVSYYVYIARILHVFNIIDTKKASLLWPLVKLTSVMGIVSIIMKHICNEQVWNANYIKCFILPITEGFDKRYHIFVDLFAILFKLHLLRNYPRNNRFTPLSIVFFLGYCIFGFYNGGVDVAAEFLPRNGTLRWRGGF